MLAEGELTFKWKGSGIKLSEPRVLLVTIRDGLIVRMYGYRDRKEALEAAGLRGQFLDAGHWLTVPLAGARQPEILRGRCRRRTSRCNAS